MSSREVRKQPLRFRQMVWYRPTRSDEDVTPSNCEIAEWLGIGPHGRRLIQKMKGPNDIDAGALVTVNADEGQFFIRQGSYLDAFEEINPINVHVFTEDPSAAQALDSNALDEYGFREGEELWVQHVGTPHSTRTRYQWCGISPSGDPILSNADNEDLGLVVFDRASVLIFVVVEVPVRQLVLVTEIGNWFQEVGDEVAGIVEAEILEADDEKCCDGECVEDADRPRYPPSDEVDLDEANDKLSTYRAWYREMTALSKLEALQDYSKCQFWRINTNGIPHPDDSLAVEFVDDNGEYRRARFDPLYLKKVGPEAMYWATVAPPLKAFFGWQNWEQDGPSSEWVADRIGWRG